MLSKKEIKIFEEFQFFDKHRRFPFDKKRVDLTLRADNIIKLKKISEKSKESMSTIVDGFIKKVIL